MGVKFRFTAFGKPKLPFACPSIIPRLFLPLLSPSPIPCRAARAQLFSNLQCQCSSLTTFFFEHSSSRYCRHNIMAAQFEKQSAVLQFFFSF